MGTMGRSLGALAAAGALALSLPSAAAAAPAPSVLVLRGTNYCIAVEHGVALAANPVVLAPCSGSESQQFLVRGPSLIYGKTIGHAIPLCIGNRRALGRAVLLNCLSHNAQVKRVALRSGGHSFRLTGGFLSGPALGQLRIQNSTHATGREAFLQLR